MSEVGLVPFARVALEVSQEVVPVYSHRFSPQRFTPAIVGDFVLDALRGLDVPRGGSSLGRTR